MSKATTPLSCRIDPELKDAAEHVARRLGITLTELVEAALHRYIETEEDAENAE